MTDTQAALIYSPMPDADVARSVAGKLLDEKLIACANILGPMESIFVWNGKLDQSFEVGVIFKTTQSKVDLAIQRLGELHPYETPAIVGSVCNEAHPDTLEWLAQQVGDSGVNRVES
ncbi:MAG: divalent-cation tolerance protein CutA [Pseudomonadota bacterium]